MKSIKKINLSKRVSVLMMLVFINAEASIEIDEISALGQLIFNQVQKTSDVKFPKDINSRDLYETAYLPIDLQVRHDSVGFEQSDLRTRREIHELVSKVLSPRGYLRFIANLEMSNQFHTQLSKSTDHVFKFYGIPSSGSWGFKFEGYHMSISFLIKNHELKFINYFLGQDFKVIENSEINPDSIYYTEVETGIELMNRLSPKQIEKTYLSINTPLDIMTNPKQSFLVMEQLGLPSKSLKKRQMSVFKSWINGYLNQFSEAVISSVITGLDKQDFENFRIIWSGDFNIPHADLYYLVYNDGITIEHSFKENHLHTITRVNF